MSGLNRRAGLNELVAPKIAVWLSKIKHSADYSLKCDAIIIMVNSQISTMFIMEVVTVLLAPIFAVYVLDGEQSQDHNCFPYHIECRLLPSVLPQICSGS